MTAVKVIRTNWHCEWLQSVWDKKWLRMFCDLNFIILFFKSSYNCLRVIGDRSETCRRFNSRNFGKKMLAVTLRFVCDKPHTSRGLKKMVHLWADWYINVIVWEESQFRLRLIPLFFHVDAGHMIWRVDLSSSITRRQFAAHHNAVAVRSCLRFLWEESDAQTNLAVNAIMLRTCLKVIAKPS